MARKATQAPISWETFKQARDMLDAQITEASKALQACNPNNERTPLGLTPDHIKFSEAYRKAKNVYDSRIWLLRDLNQKYVKFFSNEIREEINQKRLAKINANR